MIRIEHDTGDLKHEASDLVKSIYDAPNRQRRGHRWRDSERSPGYHRRPSSGRRTEIFSVSRWGWSLAH